MIEKKVNTTSEDVQKSVASIYSELLNKRRAEKEIKEEQKRLEKEAKRISKEERGSDSDANPITKKEKRATEIESWKEIIIGLTGEDLDYISPKKNKKKYKKWIDEDTGENVILTSKPAKKKKKNYNKEFEPELNMLKAIVADQNRFTIDLLKRYQTAAGPNNKDAMPLNKTLVELAAVINASRSNSLGVLREIGNIKKTIADLYMKQIKANSEGGGSDSNDIGLMGSNVAASIWGSSDGRLNSPVALGDNQITLSSSQHQYPTQTSPQTFDPTTWDGGGLDDNHTKFESIPHTIVVEWHKNQDKARFKAIRKDTGEELVGCPVPTCSIKSIDTNTKFAKDDFDQPYRVEIIE